MQVPRNDQEVKTFIFKSWMIGALRKASYRYPPRYGVMNEAKVERGKYRCAHCQQIHPRKDVQVDHVVPVVPIEGFPTLPDGNPNWNVYIHRMFPTSDGFQVLCTGCHNVKTQSENSGRRANRDAKKTVRKRSKK
jgi:hypothetical protein